MRRNRITRLYITTCKCKPRRPWLSGFMEFLPSLVTSRWSYAHALLPARTSAAPKTNLQDNALIYLPRGKKTETSSVQQEAVSFTQPTRFDIKEREGRCLRCFVLRVEPVVNYILLRVFRLMNTLLIIKWNIQLWSILIYTIFLVVIKQRKISYAYE